MARSENKKTSIRRRRLVIFLLLLVLVQGTGTGTAREFSLEKIELRQADEILAQKEDFLFQHPWSYLPFLPGPILLLILLILKRKKLLLFLFLSLAFTSLSSQDEPENDPLRALQKGTSEYEAGFYHDALDNFLAGEKLISPRSSLKFNIAACYYKLGKIGFAIDALVQGIKLAPGDEELRLFLTKIEEQYKLTAQVDVLPLFHSDIPFIITIVLFNLCFITYSLTFRLKKGSIAIVFVFMVVFTITSFSLFLYNNKHISTPSGVVNPKAAIIKKIPRQEAKDWILLKEGTIVRVLGETQDFVLIQTGRSLKGWIEKDDLLTR